MANLDSQVLLPPCELVIGGEHYHARYLGPEDVDAFIALHQEIFGGRFNPQWYQWKYHDHENPSLGLWTDTGQLIAHCGGVARSLWCKQETVRALQITDVMVHPRWRAILSRRGPFYWVCYLLYHDQIGQGRAAQLGYGFPSQRHLQLATKLQLSFDGGSIWQLHWPSVPNSPAWFWRYRILRADEAQWSSAIEHAWRTMHAHTRHLCIGERSLSNIRWRYAKHPEHDHVYLSLERPWSRTSRGIAIVRRHADLDRGLWWLDWIGPPEQIQEALAMVRQYAADHQFTEVLAWGSNRVREALRNTLQYSETPIAGLGIPSASFGIAQPVDQQPWWWTAGDTDFL